MANESSVEIGRGSVMRVSEIKIERPDLYGSPCRSNHFQDMPQSTSSIFNASPSTTLGHDIFSNAHHFEKVILIFW